MIKYIPIAGTNAWRDGWMHADSDFGRMMQAEDFELLRPHRPFRWSTALDGLLGEDRDWIAAGDALCWYLDRVPFEYRNIVAHSHGGQLPLLCAATYRCQLRSLTTVGTPPRDDIPLARAEESIAFHQHIYDLQRDFWGWLGQVGDHELRCERTLADNRVKNIGVADISHSKVLRDPKYIGLWKSEGWLSNIRSVAAAGV